MVSILMPTLLVEESRHGRIALQAACSIRAIMAGVAKTSRSPLPITAATLVVSTIASLVLEDRVVVQLSFIKPAFLGINILYTAYILT